MVHSQQLGANLSVGTGAVTLYTTPSTVRTILKSLVLCNTNAAANFIAVEVVTGAGAIAIWRYFLAAAGTAGDSVTDLPWVVLLPGHMLVVVAHAASVSVIASGSELQL